MPRLTIRIDFDNAQALGPGKVRLLELVDSTGSIRKAAAGMRMSYRRAWLLLKALEETFGEPVVVTSTGGAAGGGARLSSLGKRVVTQYRTLEELALAATRRPLEALAKASAGVGGQSDKKAGIRPISRRTR